MLQDASPTLAELPHVWRVRDLAREEATVPSGHAVLDALLPGGGWPLGGLVELLQPRAHAPVWQLLLPGLARQCAAHAGPVVLVGAPCLPFPPALQAQGLPADRLLCVKAAKTAPRLWAAEQALRCADVAAVIAWLPQCRAAELRRLQLAALKHGRLAFVLRGVQARHEATPARLRLLLQADADALAVHFLKRRGPPVTEPVLLPPVPAALADLLAARRGRPPSAPAAPPTTRRSHVLDRPVSQP